MGDDSGNGGGNGDDNGVGDSVGDDGGEGGGDGGDSGELTRGSGTGGGRVQWSSIRGVLRDLSGMPRVGVIRTSCFTNPCRLTLLAEGGGSVE